MIIGASRRVILRGLAAASAIVASLASLAPIALPAEIRQVATPDAQAELAEFAGVATDDESTLTGPLGEWVSSRFGGPDESEPLYLPSRPELPLSEPEWLDPEQLIATHAFEKDPPEPDVIEPVPVPVALWDRKQRRIERRRRKDSWLRAPLGIEKFTGIINTDEPIHHQIHNGLGDLFGIRAAWDFAPRLGLEQRLGYVRSTLNDTLHPFLPSHENFWFCDTNLMIYPRGDTRFRPFAMVGLGLVNVGFIDDRSVSWNQTLLTFPFGVGLKYRIDDRNALRIDVSDTVVYGSAAGGDGAGTMHNVAVLFAYQRRFGWPHKNYFPKQHTGPLTRLQSSVDSLAK